jgi:GNAT superfamily N-acetyltransferase
MINVHELKKNEKNKIMVEKFIKRYDSSFKPSISRQVEITEYVEKVFSQGHFFGIKSDKSIEGLIGFYCNDEESKRGYITYLSVGKKLRGKGVGKTLVTKCTEKCEVEGMKKLRVQTWSDNKSAINLYKSKGFKCVDKYVDDFSVEKIVLEKEIK